jgi:hypothetical protein
VQTFLVVHEILNFMKIFKNVFDEMIRVDVDKYITETCAELILLKYEFKHYLCYPNLNANVLYLPSFRSTMHVLEQCNFSLRSVRCLFFQEMNTRILPAAH